MIQADPPRRLGPYRIERLLGQGGMGTVYAAYDERLARRVALKRVLAKDADPRRQLRLRREARSVARIAHPNVVEIFDLLEEEDGDWIVMEWVEGKPLAEMVPVGVETALDYGRQIAEGLDAAHERGIVHRDLKTENVVVLPQGRVKILDFGLAKELPGLKDEPRESTLSIPGQIMGTVRAMSPEQARGIEVSPRSDLFSLGVLLYETLSGISPFRAENFVDTVTRIATFQPVAVDELVPEAPRGLAELVDRLLQKAPEQRPSSAREVADELGRLAEEKRVRPRPSHGFTVTVSGTIMQPDAPLEPMAVSEPDGAAASRSPARPLRRRLAVATAMILTLALGVVGLVLLPRGSGPPRPPSARDAESGTVAGAHEPAVDPLALYEEGMRAVRRIDRPDSVERAVETFQRLLELDGDSAAAHAGLARSYWEKARSSTNRGDPIHYEQAASAAREAVRLDPYLADARVSLGLTELSQGRLEHARSELGTALELDPDNADAWYGLARLEVAAGRPELAEQHHRRAIGLRPTPMYLDALGALLYASGRYDEAEAVFLESLELAPDNIFALRNLGSLNYARGRLGQAAAALQSALKIRPDASLYSNLGTIFFSQGLYAKAAAAYESALSRVGASNKAIFWINLADAYRQMPDKEEETATHYRRALELLEEQIAAAPRDVRLLSRRALTAARAGDLGTARADLDRIRELGPGGNVYSRLRVSTAQELLGDRESALASLEAALRAGLALPEARREPDLLELRADPRFHRLLMTLDRQED